VKPSARLAVCVALAGLPACGDPNSLGGGRDPLGGGTGGTSGSLGSAGGGAGGTGGTSGSVGTGGGGGSDAGSLPEEVTLTLGPFLVDTGREAFMCQTFANPFGGSDVFIREIESHMTPGSHHFLMNAVVDPVSGLSPCTTIDTPVGPYATQVPDDVFGYPPGIAAPLPGTNNLKMMSHYLNSSPTLLVAEVSVTLRRARPETVQQVAWVKSLSSTDINVPPRGSQTVEGGITLEPREEWDVYWIIPHMHQRGTRFSVSAGPGGVQQVYETDRWLAPSRRFDPPLRLSAGDSLNYACTFFNDTTAPLTFGESALDNEMCVLVFHYTEVGVRR
jgi:hypothetical protein